jgi:UrcA family protein
MRTFFLLALLIGGGAGEPAWASPDSSDPIATIRYNDLDLGSASGKAALDARIKRAVRNVCSVPGPKTIENNQRVTACMDQAWKNAARQIP